MGLWDLSFKVLSRARPQDLLGLVAGIDPSRSLRLIDKEFEPRLPLPRALDACLEYEDERGEGVVFQLEFESEPRSDTGRRVFEHAALAHLTLKRIVRPVVLYLTPGKEGRRPHDSYHWSANGRAVLRFRFEKVCLWELPAEAILRRPAPALWAVVALCCGARLEHVERAFRQIEQTVEDPDVRRDLQGALYWIAGTRFERTHLMAIVPKEVLMKSSTYEATLEEGREEGRKEGIEEGKKEGKEEGKEEGEKKVLRRLCNVLLKLKLDELPPEAERISSIEEVERLERLADALEQAADPAAVRAALRREVGE
ncbi:MAG: hypothetical protein ACOX6T_23245 [Myxococcales bacterium]|jgi:predicted transposase YdaD